MLAKYKMSTGLSEVRDRLEFESDHEAWNTMRLILPGKYATLYRWTRVPCMINNRDVYLEKHNSKYTSQIIDAEVPYTYEMWIPVIVGITDDEYDATGEIEICQKTGTSISLHVGTEHTTPE
jgi:hypothetical protein